MRRKLEHRFSSVFRTDLGHQVRVELQDAADISQEADFRPRRIAVVQRTPLVSAGTVIYGEGSAFLLVDQSSLPNLLRFRAFEITHQLLWRRRGVTIDPATGFERESTLTTLATALPVVVDPVRVIPDQGIERNKMRIFTGATVAVGDMIGTYEVHVITPVLGVFQLDVF